MKSSIIKSILIVFLYLVLQPCHAFADTHEITFCSEKIPVDNDFVAQKLMNSIRRQIPEVNLPALRKRVKEFFPIVEYYLRGTGLPEDLKYVAVVESGFVGNATSRVGAGGFWQFMPEVAKEYGLNVNASIDDRNDIHKSTYAACRHLAAYYNQIRKKYNVSSWILTAAAYNVGIGRIFDAVNRQGKNYFSMKLNPETAVYVYKIIAVKELFEYPEIYMKNFSYNIFAKAKAPSAVLQEDNASTDLQAFQSMEVKVNEQDGQHPDAVTVTNEPITSINPNNIKSTTNENQQKKIKLVAANLKGKYKGFEDGKVVLIELQEDLQVKNRFIRSGNTIKGTGWIIDDRVFIDLGFDDHDVILYDSNSKQGIALDDLKNNEPLLLKVQKEEE